MLIFKRNPQEVAITVNALLAILAFSLDWKPVVTGLLVALVSAAATAFQYLNVVSSDQFTTAAVGLAGSAMALAVGLGFDGLTNDVQIAVLAAIPMVLGLLVRNGVTNVHTPAGRAVKA